MSRLASALRRALVVALFCLAPTALFATTYTWDVTSGNGAIDDGSGAWSTSVSNWTSNGGATNVAWTDNGVDIASFGGSGSTGGTVTASGAFTAGGILFNGTDSGSYTIGGTGGAVVILGTSANTATVTINSGAGAETFASTLSLAIGSKGNSLTFANNSSNTLTVNSTIFSTYNSGNNVTLIFNGSGNTVVNGAIFDAGPSRVGLTYSGSGQLTLNAANQFSQPVTISSGSILLGNVQALQATVGSNAGTSDNVTISVVNGLKFAAAANTAPFMIPSLSGAGNEALVDTLGNPVTLQLGYFSGTQQSYSGVLSGTGGITFAILGQETLKNQNLYTGNTTALSGVTVLDFSSASVSSNLINPSSKLVLGGGNMQLNGKGGGNDSQTFNGVTLNPGASTISTVQNGATTIGATLGAITRNPGSSLLFLIPATPSAGTISTTTKNDNFAGGQATILGYATVASTGTTLGGTTWAVSAGNGTNSGAITGLTTYSTMAALVPGLDADAPTTGTDTAATSAAETINSLRFNATASGTNPLLAIGASGSSQTLTIATGGILVNGANAPNVMISSAGNGANTSKITSGNGSDLIIYDNSSGNMTISAAITDNSLTPIGLTIMKQNTNTNTVTLSGPNTFSGGLTIGTITPNNGNVAFEKVAVTVISDTGTSNIGDSTSPTNNVITLSEGLLAYGASSGIATTARNIVVSNALGGEIAVTSTATLNLNGAIASSAGPMTAPLICGGGNTSPNSILALGGSTDNTNLLVSATSSLLKLNKASSSTVHAAAGIYNITNAAVQITGTGGDQIADSGNVTISSNGTFDLNNNTETVRTVYMSGTGNTSDLTLTNNNYSGAIINSGQNLSTGSLAAVLTATNLIAMTGSTTLGVAQPAGSLTLNGTIVGPGLNLTKAGPGTLILTGNSIYTGTTIVNLGTLNLNGGSLGGTAVTIGNGTVSTANGTGNATLLISGNVTIGTNSAAPNNSAISGSPGGSLTLAGGNGTATGQGTLDMRDGTINTLTLGNTTAGNVNLTIGGTSSGLNSILDFDIGANSTDQIAVGQKLTLNLGGAVINLNQLPSTNLAANTYNLITYASGSTFAGAFTFAGGSATQTVGTKMLTLQQAVSGTAEQLVVTNLFTPIYWLGGQGATGSGIWNTNNSGSTNWTSDAQGTTEAGQVPGAGSDVNFIATGGANVNTTLGQDFSIAGLIFNSSASSSVTIGGTNTLTLGADGILVQSGSAAHTISSKVALGSSQTWANNSANTLTVSGAISDSTNNGLTIGGGAGAGTIIVSAANTYNGPTTITSGTLQLGNALAVQNSTLSVSTANGLAFSGSITTFTLGGLSGGSDIALTDVGTGPVTLLIGNNGAITTYSGALSGGGAIVKIGAGSLTLSGSNSSYSGGTTISQGTLIAGANAPAGANGALGNTAAAVALGDANTGNSAVALLAASGVTVGLPVTVQNFVTSGGYSIGSSATSGTQTFAGAMTLNQPVTISQAGSGTLRVTGGINNGGNLVTLTGTGGIVVSTAGISGDGGLLAGGTGLVQLNVANAFSGGTTINSGATVQLGAGGALQNSTVTVTPNNGLTFLAGVNAGNFTLGGLAGGGNINLADTLGGPITLQVGNNNAPTTYSGSLSGATSALTKIGNGSLTLSGSSSYGGGTTLTSGTLRVTNSTNGSATGGGTVTLNGGTLAGSVAGGSIGGPVAAGSGQHIIAPGAGLAPGTFGSLTLNGGLTTSGNTTLTFNLGAPVSNDTYTGDLLFVNGAGLAVGSETNITFGVNPTTVGKYRLIGGNFGSNPAVGNFVLPNPSYSLSVMDDPGFIDLVVSVFAVSGAWDQAGDGSYSETAKWNPVQIPTGVGLTDTFGGGSMTNPIDGTTVSSHAIAIAVDGAYTAGKLLFDNSAVSYTLTNDAVNLHGLKLDNGGADNSGFTGAVVEVDHGSHTIAANLTLADSAGTTFNLAGGSSLAVTGTIAGSGANQSLTLTGGGALTLGNTNGYNGGTVVAAGSLQTTAGGALGGGSLGINADVLNSAVTIGKAEMVSSLSGTQTGNGGLASLTVDHGGSLNVNQSGATNFAGSLTLNGPFHATAAGTLTKSGGGTLELDGTTNLGDFSTLTVSDTGTLRFHATSSGMIGGSVVASVASGATLELAGSVSALGAAGGNRVEIQNDGNLLVSGTGQVVGGIENLTIGKGTVTIDAGSDLTADHITTTSLVIGGDTNHAALLTIDPSNPDGISLATSSDFALTDNVAPGTPFASGTMSASSLLTSGSSSFGDSNLVSLDPSGGGTAVPEPSTMLLVALGSLAFLLASRQSAKRATRRVSEGK